MQNCQVLKDEGNRKLVEFHVSVIKTFSYKLWMTETPNSEIRWEFAGGDIFKESTGSWKMSDEAGKTRATYAVEAKFGVFVPKMIAKTLVNVNLPTMMSAYHKRVSELYGG